MRRLAAVAAWAVLYFSCWAPLLSAQLRPSSGADLYAWACAACHGKDGKGAPPALVGFDIELPDFTDCSFATPERDLDWLVVSHKGGPGRAFNRRMPAFGEVLSDAEIRSIVGYMRSFCTDPSWPRGELNVPRPLVTEKAFPENEAVWTLAASRGDEARVSNTLVYERRFGARNMFEVALPLSAQRGAEGWQRGVGDVALAVKRAIVHSHERGRILSVGGELVIPTGSESRGLGGGVAIAEPFAAFAQLLPANSFLQVQAGLELPFDRDKANNEGFWRATVGKTFLQGTYARGWTPMLEVLGSRELAGGEGVLWDLVPEMQVTLSRRQHVMAAAGVRLPLNERPGRPRQLLAYVLWDWADGGLFEGWR